ncbi:TB2/DP1, HVA22 family-domain-containing protein [Amylocystis lapponica]|nr:TB2/DP1, HVA22 family-domain-containing protein [Amylocystis lapponica]
MLLYITFRVISATTAFLYPGYASYKTLSQRPASEADLERWLMYWSVLGCIVAVEYVAEWLVSWLPLYYTIKTIFLLYLALPQTAGSDYLYRTHLRPFFAAHETQIDSALAQLKAYVYASLQRFLRAAWDHVSGTLRQMQGQPGAPASTAAHTGAPPSLADPVSGPAQLAQGLWSNFGPGLLVSGAALLRQAQASAAQAATPSARSPEERRRQLQSELASLSDAAPYDVSPLESPAAAPAVPLPGPASRDSSASSGELRERSGSGSGNGRGVAGAFEEVEVPSDMEGEGHTGAERPGQGRRASWFGWGAGAGVSPGKGYEKLKND